MMFVKYFQVWCNGNWLHWFHLLVSMVILIIAIVATFVTRFYLVQNFAAWVCWYWDTHDIRKYPKNQHYKMIVKCFLVHVWQAQHSMWVLQCVDWCFSKSKCVNMVLNPVTPSTAAFSHCLIAHTLSHYLMLISMCYFWILLKTRSKGSQCLFH